MTSVATSRYAVVTQPTPNISGCNAARPLPFNAMVIAKGATERRVECVWRDGMAIAVTRVETVEVSPLSAWYLEPGSAVAGRDRGPGRAGSSQRPRAASNAAPWCPRRSELGSNRDEIGWRDLVDFYARHRCQTYRFPSSYRAFKSDGERAIPVVGARACDAFPRR